MKKLFHVAFILAALSSCAKLDLLPEGVNSTSNFFKTPTDANAAVIATYASLANDYLYNQFMEVIQSQGTDDCEWGNGRNTQNADKNQLDKFTYDAGTNLFYQFWSTSYIVINRANVAIDNIARMSNISDDLKRQYTGEARFVRALMYFNLVRLWGAVPLVTTATTSLTNLEIARSSPEDVYAQIIEDFKYGEDNLPQVYSAKDAGRATKGAAMTMLVKVYLTKKQYQPAVDEARKVMALGIYSLWPNYADVFVIANKNARESIFEIQYQSGSGNIGSNYAGFFRPSFDKRPFAGFGDNPVTKNHFDAYPAGDLRKAVNVIEYSYTTDPKAPTTIRYPYYVAKYQDPSALTTAGGGNNYYITRYADLLLMFAETLNQVDPTSTEAYEAFNQVRRRAYGLPITAPSGNDLLPGLTPVQFQDSVMNERRLEFAFEGQRRFDLLRTGKLVSAMQQQDAGIRVNEYLLLFPIPSLELNVNKLLTQNPGY